MRRDLRSSWASELPVDPLAGRASQRVGAPRRPTVVVEETPELVVGDEPRGDGADRYAIYVVRPDWTRGSQVDHADGRKRLAETSLSGIGVCLQTLREEGDLTNDSRVGILDRESRTWLVNPWARGDPR